MGGPHALRPVPRSPHALGVAGRHQGGMRAAGDGFPLVGVRPYVRRLPRGHRLRGVQDRLARACGRAAHRVRRLEGETHGHLVRMGSADEVRDAVDACRRAGNDQVVLLKCTSEYPAVYEDMNIATMADMRQRFGFPVGLSDHSMGYAVGRGRRRSGRERHREALLHHARGGDGGLRVLDGEGGVRRDDPRRAQREGRCGRVSYTLTEKERRGLAGRRSLYAVKPIKKGECFTRDNVRSIRPALRHCAEALGKSFSGRSLSATSLLATRSRRAIWTRSNRMSHVWSEAFLAGFLGWVLAQLR